MHILEKLSKLINKKNNQKPWETLIISENLSWDDFSKINLYALPDVKKLRFNATQMLFWQKFSFSLYNTTVTSVTEIRNLLRQELDL